MASKGFYNIDNYMGMWEMFIAVFVKKDLRKEIHEIKKTYLAKGQMGLIGNKGAVAYSFILRNRVFNFIGVHLKHG